MKNFLAGILALAITLAIMVAGAVFSVGVCLAVSLLACSLINYFVGYTLFGNVAIGLIALMLFFIGQGRKS